MRPDHFGIRVASALGGIFFLIFNTVVLISCPAALAALEPSSKKECAMCHVMWLDVFRTDQETLIPWQPGNVLMKDTQGIVSSEEICYSCHDGYVLDSRHIVWKGNNHSTFKKPTENIKIPEEFTLSNKDEIYCGTCHTPHSAQASGIDESGEAIAGPNSFLRVPNVDASMCEACHVNAADFKRTNGHPVHTDKLKIPDQLFASGSVPAGKKDTVTCQTCHRVHGAKARNLTVMDNRGSELCMSCHAQRTILGTPHDPALGMPAEINIKGQPISESGPCGACHVPHNSAGYRLWARTMPSGNPASAVCLSCHGEDPEPNVTREETTEIRGIGRYSHPIGIAAVSESVSGTGPGQARSNLTDKLPFFSQNGMVTAAGTVQCGSCHNIHQWDPADPGRRGGKDVDGDASNSFLRIAASPTSALCVECHRAKRAILSHDHNLAVTAPNALNIRDNTPEVSGPCGACHIPHHAADETLWARELIDDKEDRALHYCTGCHAETGAAKDKPVGKNDHPVNAVAEGSHRPLPERVNARLPLYNAQGGTENGDRMMCRTCHDPHAWSAGSDDIGSFDEAVPEPGIEKIEGDARNSFLRLPASPAPSLCIVCHEDSALLTGTDHDLFVTAPSANNRLAQTVFESGPCGTCHAVHNSPEKRLLWAAAYGPVAENQHSMNGLCTGCHSAGGIAETKIPPATGHPEGQLITNIMTVDKQTTGYIRIYDDNWQAVRVGDVSCSSCHSFSRWNHKLDAPGPGQNVEGDADTSFLRTSSDRTVCIDCHGETAIWRYTYFHSLEKREMLKSRQP